MANISWCNPAETATKTQKQQMLSCDVPTSEVFLDTGLTVFGWRRPRVRCASDWPGTATCPMAKAFQVPLLTWGAAWDAEAASSGAILVIMIFTRRRICEGHHSACGHRTAR